MKIKSDLPLKRWAWTIGVYCVSCAIAMILGTFLVNTGKIRLDNSGLYLILTMLISGLFCGLLSNKLPLQWAAVSLGIIMLFNAACSLLVFSGISSGFILQNGALTTGYVLSYFLVMKHNIKRKGKRRHKKYS